MRLGTECVLVPKTFYLPCPRVHRRADCLSLIGELLASIGLALLKLRPTIRGLETPTRSLRYERRGLFRHRSPFPEPSLNQA